MRLIAFTPLEGRKKEPSPPGKLAEDSVPQWADECCNIAEIIYNDSGGTGCLDPRVCSVGVSRSRAIMRANADITTGSAQRDEVGCLCTVMFGCVGHGVSCEVGSVCPWRAAYTIRSATARLPNTSSHCSRDAETYAHRDGHYHRTDEHFGDDSVPFAHSGKALA